MSKKKIKRGNGKIFVGIPRERIYLTQFVDNRDALLAHLSKTKRMGGYFQAESHRVDRNRDRIVEEFLHAEKKPEWLLMLDTDMEHPIDAPHRLTSYKKPIVGALYFARGAGNHTPFVFKELTGRKDKYGRPAFVWAPMAKTVYKFLDDNRVPMRDGAITIRNPVGEPLIECDAVATGCMVIHRSVLEDMPAPVFEYRQQGNSEDLVFCREAKAMGWPVYADLSTICGHFHWVPMGQAQFRMDYVNAGINETTFTKREAAEWLSKMWGIPVSKAVKEIEEGNTHMLGPLWKERFADRIPSGEEMLAFYEDEQVGKLYMIELLHWNYTTGFNQIRQQLVGIRESNVIELGAGIGSVAIQLALQDNNVLAVEVNQGLRDFIDMRWDEINSGVNEPVGQLSIVGRDWLEKSPDNSFNVAVAIDTLEHMSKDELLRNLKELGRVLVPGGRFVFHNNWEQQDIYPMHADHKELFYNYMKSGNGWTLLSDMEAVHE